MLKPASKLLQKLLFTILIPAVLTIGHYGCAPVPQKPVLTSETEAVQQKYGEQAVYTGTCVSVHDGDTLRVETASETLKIRLQGVDTPEISQSDGQAARQFTYDMTYEKPVTVYSFGKDRYGRTLGIVECEGKNLNLELVKAGWAWHYKYYSDDPELAAAETAARKAGLGIWKNENPQAPWDYRREKRTKSAEK